MEPFNHAIAKAVVETTFPSLRKLVNLQAYKTEFIKNLHPNIMKQIDGEPLDMLLDHIALQGSLSMMKTIQTFFLMSLHPSISKRVIEQISVLNVNAHIVSKSVLMNIKYLVRRD